jgi:cold shock CspA family protein
MKFLMIKKFFFFFIYFIKVSFNVGQDRRTNQFFARNVSLIEKILPPPPPPPPSNTKRFRGVISTMKDSFGFIEREDALKEIFFHITEFGPNVATNTIQPGVEVEFDIQDRHVCLQKKNTHQSFE